jgi:hypothetical protein
MVSGATPSTRHEPGMPAGYYALASVRQRMAEFIGTAAYLVGADGSGGFSEPASPRGLPRLLERGLDVERSLWDRELLVFDLDLEYQNFDRPALAWWDPARVFRLQEPVLAAATGFLHRRGIEPLILVSGRGYHLVWAISRRAEAFHRLARLGQVPPSLAARYAEARSPDGGRVDGALGRAFAGQGLLLAYVAQAIREAAMAKSALPIQVTALEVGVGAAGREIISVDVSEYGDPFHSRHIRIPFSLYLKPREPRWRLGEAQLRSLLPIVQIPQGGMDGPEASAAARCPETVMRLAEAGPTHIPIFSRAMSQLITEYEGSTLGKWHRECSCRIADAPAKLPAESEARIPGAPPCLNWLFAHANDWLLKPAALQHAVRVLMALDWQPAAIARRIYEAYRRDGEWGDTWVALDPAQRAEFYTRLFAGMIHTGADSLIDLNCVSHQEKGYCMVPDCRANLADFRDRLQARWTA